MIPRRFAGYRLAGLPLENVSGKVKEAADVLKNNYTQMPTYEESIDIPGTEARVVMNAWPNGGINLRTDSNIAGNPGEVQKIIDAKPPGVLTLGWGLEGDRFGLNDKQRFKAARIAQKEFKRIFADIPNGTIVQNAPIGGMSGNYTRADAYMSQGMGPLQHDGQQYAIMNNGEMTPVSPFTPLEGHAEHLSRRSSAGGQVDIANLIQDELASRRDRQAYGYEDSPPPSSRYVDENGINYVGPTEFKDFTVREMTEDAYRSEHMGGGESYPLPANHEDRVVRDERRIPHLPEIAQRNVAKDAIQGISQSEYLQLNNRDPFDNSPAFNVTPQEIGEFRDEQTRFASQPSYLRDMSDIVEGVYNRPSPPVLSIDDAGRVLQDRRRPRTRDLANADLNLTEDDRRTIMRNRVGGMFTGGRAGVSMADSDPNDLRSTRSGFSDHRSDRARPNSPALVEDMRTYQAIAARVDPYLRGPRTESDANRASTNPDIAMAVQLDPSRTPLINITGRHSRTPDPNNRVAGPRVPPVESREFPAPRPRGNRVRTTNPSEGLMMDEPPAPSAVDAIRDELGLRRRSSNGSLVPETNDIPF